MWENILQQVIMAIVGAAITGVSGVVAFYVNILINEARKRSLISEIHRTVQWVEQDPTYEGITGEQKYDIVYEIVSGFANRNNINVTAGEIKIMIESAVKQMNDFTYMGRRDLDILQG